jgi:AbrB family looped-hinge helix DNA binding protein
VVSAYSVKVDSKGRLTIPQPLRAALGIEPGDTLFVETEGGNVLRYAKADNPFDVLADRALAERRAGRTKGLREFAAEHDSELDGA